MDAQSIQIFTFHQDHAIRTFVDDKDEIWFCRKDVLDILGLNSNTKLLNSLDPKGVAISDSLTQGGKQKLIYINEPNLYRIIFKSTKPDAKLFQDWIFNEVLPALRKHGHYEIPQQQKAENEFTGKEMQTLSDFIYRCSMGFSWDQSFRDGCWYRLRKLTGVASPNKFRHSDVKIIVNELTRLLNISDYYRNVCCKAEQEIIKRVVRDGKNSVELFEILNNMIVKVTDDSAIEKIRTIGSNIDQADLLSLRQAG